MRAMPELAIDPMVAAAWSVLQADGVTPSAELSRTDETATVRYGPDRHALRLDASTAAIGHLARRTLAADVDLSAHDELRVWLHSSRPAAGTPERPFLLELRLGSTALPPDAAGNLWHRYLSAPEAGAWELTRMTLADLAPAVRGAVRTVQLRCLTGLAFRCVLDDLLAVRDRMLEDAERGLFDRLHLGTAISGTPVPAFVYAAGATPPAAPYLRITALAVDASDGRTGSTGTRMDHSSAGSALRPPSFAYDLRYLIDAVADSRADEAALLEFVLERLPPRGELIVNGVALPVEQTAVRAEDLPGGHRTDRVAIAYRVLARKESGAPAVVKPVSTLHVATETQVA